MSDKRPKPMMWNALLQGDLIFLRGMSVETPDMFSITLDEEGVEVVIRILSEQLQNLKAAKTQIQPAITQPPPRDPTKN